MPLPVAHSAAGLAGYLLLREKNKGALSQEEVGLSLLCVFLANLPDADFVPGILIGNPHRFHHGPAHSILFALVATAFLYPLAAHIFKAIPRKAVLGSILIPVLSHSVLDFLSMERLPLFWPFATPGFLTFPLPLFGEGHRAGAGKKSFVEFLINAFNTKEMIIEMLFSGALLSAILTWKERSRPALVGASSLLFLLFALLYYTFQIKPSLLFL